MTALIPSEWELDRSADTPILLHKKCSVIEGEQAEALYQIIAAMTKSNQGSDTPTPACYATFRDGKMDYSEFCVSENLGDFDVSELDADVDIVPLYSEETVFELLAALTAEREKNARLREEVREAVLRNSLLREEVLEEAAKVCDGMGMGNQFYQDCAFNIRAMKEKQ